MELSLVTAALFQSEGHEMDTLPSYIEYFGLVSAIGSSIHVYLILVTLWLAK